MSEESYGGHYGPVFAEYIEAQNEKHESSGPNITLETVTIINGWMNPLIQVRYYEVSERLSLALIKGNLVSRLLQFYGTLSLPCRLLLCGN